MAGLILTRRISEIIMIGDDIKVTVLGVKGNQVRLLVNAPQNIEVHRLEIYERIQKQKERKQNNETENRLENYRPESQECSEYRDNQYNGNYRLRYPRALEK